jgi:hypothetical protein
MSAADWGPNDVWGFITYHACGSAVSVSAAPCPIAGRPHEESHVFGQASPIMGISLCMPPTLGTNLYPVHTCTYIHSGEGAMDTAQSMRYRFWFIRRGNRAADGVTLAIADVFCPAGLHSSCT